MLLQIHSVRRPVSQCAANPAEDRSQHTPYSWTSGAALLLACFFIAVSISFAAESNQHAGPKAKSTAEGKLYFDVQLSQHLKVSALKPGDIVEGKLPHAVYLRDRTIFPAGSRIRLIVGTLERRRKQRNSYWPWVIRVFTPAHETIPTFKSASIFLPNGAEIPIRVSLISISHRVRVRAQKPEKAKESQRTAAIGAAHTQERAGNKTDDGKAAERGLTMLLQAASLTPAEMTETEAEGTGSPPLPLAGPVTLVAGTKARLILLRNLSASKSRPGESFRALLLEPVRRDSRVVLPEGTLFEGSVDKRTPPRWLSRPGSIRISFGRLTLPAGVEASIVGSLAEADMDKRARTRMDSEGELRGGRPGVAWMLINLGVAGGIAKVSDDSLQLIIEAIVSTATDASTAGVARIVAGCASGIFMLTRHGRDVILPKYTEMDVVFTRPVTLSRLHPPSEAETEAPEGQRSNTAGE